MTIPVATRAGRPFDGTRRLLTRLAVLVLLMLATGIGLAGPAAAHNVLISSDPADGSTLQTAPTTVRLTFDQPVQNFEPVVTVLGPDGQRYESGTPQVDSNVVTNTIGALPSAGARGIQRLPPGSVAPQGLVVTATVREIQRGSAMTGDKIVVDVSFVEASARRPVLTTTVEVSSIRMSGPEGYTFGGRIKFACLNLADAIAAALREGRFPR